MRCNTRTESYFIIKYHFASHLASKRCNFEDKVVENKFYIPTYLSAYIDCQIHFYNFLLEFLNQDFAFNFSSGFAMCLFFLNKNNHYNHKIITR